MMKRYSVHYRAMDNVMFERPDGEWVKWEDVKREAEMAQTAEKIPVSESKKIKACREHIEDMRLHYRIKAKRARRVNNGTT